MQEFEIILCDCAYSAKVALATQQQIQGVQQIATTSGKPTKVMDIQQQQSQQNKSGVSGQRPLNILPSSLQAANIRAASSVSTQTVHGVQATVQAQVTIILTRDNHREYSECYEQR